MHIYVLFLGLNMWSETIGLNLQTNRNPMKFTNEQLREKIVADLGGSRKLSDRSINEMIASLVVFAGDEAELDDFFAKVKPQFVTANGNLIKEQADFVRDWNDKHPGQPTPTKTDDTPPAHQFSSEQITAETIAKIIDERLKPFSDTFTKMQAEKTTEELFSEAKIKFLADYKPNEENERIKAILDRTFKTVKQAVKSDSDVTLLVSSMKAEFEDLAQVTGISTPYIPVDAGGGSAGSEGTPEFYKNQRDSLKNEGFIRDTPGVTK